MKVLGYLLMLILEPERGNRSDFFFYAMLKCHPTTLSVCWQGETEQSASTEQTVRGGSWK